MKRLLLAWCSVAPLALLPVACGNADKGQDTAPDTQDSAQAKGPRKTGPIDGEFAVQCGCQIDGINSCGNYVHVEGHAYEIMGDLGLGVMEWCSVDGTKQATVQGKLEGDKCYATSLTVAP